MKWRIVVTDLQWDGYGWSVNGCWFRDATVEIPEEASDLTIARTLKRAGEIRGWRADSWCQDKFCWRDGALGAWAEEVEEVGADK